MTHALCEEVGVAREAAERLVDEVGGLADASRRRLVSRR
jgi:hypothetical protein